MPIETFGNGSKYQVSLPDKSSSFEIFAYGIFGYLFNDDQLANKYVPLGATVTSWKCGGTERLFLSSKALLDGSKAVRGGIPLVFPQFGTGTNSPKIQHGFARTTKWLFVGLDKDTKDEVSIRFLLDSNREDLKELLSSKFPEFPFKFQLWYAVSMTRTSLTTSFKLKNVDDRSFAFTALLHTYFAVNDISTTVVSGLKGYHYNDKIAGKTGELESRDQVNFASEVDRVYVGAGDSKSLQLSNDIKITSTGFRDVVVWNPWIEKSKSMADMQDEGYKKMVCIELGTVDKQIELDAGSEWNASQLLTVL